VIQLRHQHPSLWEGLFVEEVAELWEPWMRVVAELLEDDELLDTVYQAQGKRRRRSRTRGRRQTPAEVALSMLVLQHVRSIPSVTSSPALSCFAISLKIRTLSVRRRTMIAGA
jgi:hypothetical protein